jgi:hypothetical protein
MTKDDLDNFLDDILPTKGYVCQESCTIPGEGQFIGSPMTGKDFVNSSGTLCRIITGTHPTFGGGARFEGTVIFPKDIRELESVLEIHT